MMLEMQNNLRKAMDELFLSLIKKMRNISSNDVKELKKRCQYLVKSEN